MKGGILIKKADQDCMLEYMSYSAEFQFWNGFMRSFTTANVVTFFVWLGFTLHFQKIDIFLWVKVLAVALTITYSGWWIDRLWFLWVAKYFAHPFSMGAYLSRLPAYLVFSVSAAIAVCLRLFPETESGAQEYILYFGVLVTGYQLIYQWIIFNRIRKLSLTQL